MLSNVLNLDLLEGCPCLLFLIFEGLVVFANDLLFTEAYDVLKPKKIRIFTSDSEEKIELLMY